MGEAGSISGAPRLHFSSLLVPLLAVLAALLLRFPALHDRPFHTDEAVNAFILEELFEQGFQYRAHDHHGPTLFYLAAVPLRLIGVTSTSQMDATTLRLVSVLCGIAMLLGVYALQPCLSVVAAHAAALAFALAAPFAYYSGMFIHETLLMLLLMLYLAAFWRLHSTGLKRWAVAAGVLAALMLGTKETAALLLIVVSLSVLAAHVLRVRQVRWRGEEKPPRFAPLLLLYAWAVGVAVAVTLLLYSNFGLHPRRAFDLFLAAGQHVSRGTGQEHAYPWWTYFAWAFGPTPAGRPWGSWFLAALGAFGAVAHWRTPFARALVFSAGGLLLVFCALPYKTPWLMLAWWLPLTLLAGLGFSTFWSWRPRAIGIVAGLLGFAALGTESYARCHRFGTDPANPLAYSPTSPDQERLARDLEVLAAEHPQGRQMAVHVVARDYWPLPWTLRHFPRTGFWTTPTSRPDDALLLIGPEAMEAFALEGELRPYELRPGVFVFLRVPPSPPPAPSAL